MSGCWSRVLVARILERSWSHRLGYNVQFIPIHVQLKYAVVIWYIYYLKTRVVYVSNQENWAAAMVEKMHGPVGEELESKDANDAPKMGNYLSPTGIPE